MIKKFKNGKIKINKIKKNDNYYRDNIGDIMIDQFYNNEITMCDLYFNQINGYMYLVDFNTQYVYDLRDINYYHHKNILIHLKELLESNNIYLYPLSKKESAELLYQLEQGY